MANKNQVRKTSAVLKQIFGEKLNEEYHLTGSLVLIGRNPKCQIKLSCPNVSRKHCILTHCDDGWRVKDNKSQNGTYINGRKLKPEENFLLEYGDIVFLGPPSEMPQAFSYIEISQCREDVMKSNDDDDHDDHDIVELPVKYTFEQNIEITPQKAAKKFIRSSKSETFEKHAGYRSSSSGSERHSKGLPEYIKGQDKAKEVLLKPVEILKDIDSSQINEISSTGSDHGENSESLLNYGSSSVMDTVPSYCPEEHLEMDIVEKCRKRKSKDSGKDTELQAKLALLSEQIKVLQESKLELLKNYEDVCEKNKALDQQLADKEKKLVDDLQEHEVKAKNEIKSELLEKLEEDLICNICTELFIKPTVLDCSHTFCEYCIKEWRKKKNDCPICRCKIKNATRVRTLEEFIDKTLATLTPEERGKRDSVVAQRFMAEHPPNPGPKRTPKRRRHGRGARSRHTRSSTSNPVSDSSIQILEDSVGDRHSRGSRINPLNLPREELNLQVNVPVFDLPVLRFFFS